MPRSLLVFRDIACRVLARYSIPSRSASDERHIQAAPAVPRRWTELCLFARGLCASTTCDNVWGLFSTGQPSTRKHLCRLRPKQAGILTVRRRSVKECEMPETEEFRQELEQAQSLHSRCVGSQESIELNRVCSIELHGCCTTALPRNAIYGRQ